MRRTTPVTNSPIGRQQTTATRPDQTPNDLLSQVGLGCTAAFDTLYRDVAREVHTLARRIVCSEAMAEEIAHDALLSVWIHSRSVDPTRGSARSWIHTITHRRAVDVVRSEQASRDRVARLAAEPTFRPWDEVAEAAMRTVEDGEVRTALDALTPLQRQAVELAYLHGLTRREVADHLGVPLGHGQVPDRRRPPRPEAPPRLSRM